MRSRIIIFVLGLYMISSTIACNLKAVWGTNCKTPQMVAMDGATIEAIVKVHNELRNKIALGKIDHYEQAANMATLEWDDDLARLATLNVYQCEEKPDNCKSVQFRNTGQNLATVTNIKKPLIKTKNIVNMVESEWFERQKTNGEWFGWMNTIKSLKSDANSFHKIFHFTQAIQYKAQKVGCAASTSPVSNYFGKETNAVWLTCNYNVGNIIGAPVYIPGRAASMCRTGKNPKYKGLCSTKEKYY